jgi:hypothetical protein
MSTRIQWVRLTTIHPEVPMPLNLAALTFQNPLGSIGLQWECFTSDFHCIRNWMRIEPCQMERCILHPGLSRPVTWDIWGCMNTNHAVQFFDLKRHCFVIKMETVPSGTWKNLSRDLTPLWEQYGPCHQPGLHASAFSLPMHLPLFRSPARNIGLRDSQR